MKAIVFDLDGTLIDSAPDIHAAANKMLKEQGFEPLDLPTITSFIGNGLPKLVERVMKAREIDMGHHDRLTQSTLTHYNAASSDLTVTYPNVIAALEELKGAGYAIGLCTNKPEAPSRDILQAFGIDGLFDVVVGGDTLEVKKPNPAPLQEAFDRLGAEETLYVGDSEIDAETARRAGIPFALFTEGYRKAEIDNLPYSVLFSDFSELPGLVAKAFRAAA